MGVIVDEVSEVQDIDGSGIEPLPELDDGGKKGLISGMGQVGKKVIILLDVDRVLSGSDLKVIEQRTEKGNREDPLVIARHEKNSNLKPPTRPG